MYIRKLIDACESFGWNGGPEFRTTIVEMANGRERRNGAWAHARHRYTLPFANIGPDEYRAIRQMFEVCRGALHSFLYRDPLDSIAENEAIGIGDGETSTFQFTKNSIIEGVVYQRLVTAFTESDDVSVFVDGSEASGISMDRDRGILVFPSPPAEGSIITWSGSFALWVRFANDWLPFSVDNRNSEHLFATGSFDLIEVPPPPVGA